jgi:hypothetical protein
LETKDDFGLIREAKGNYSGKTKEKDRKGDGCLLF